MQLNRVPFLGGFDVLESRVDRFEYTPHRHSEVVIAAYEGGFKRARCDRHAFDVERGDPLVVGPKHYTAARQQMDRDGAISRSI